MPGSHSLPAMLAGDRGQSQIYIDNAGDDWEAEVGGEGEDSEQDEEDDWLEAGAGAGAGSLPCFGCQKTFSLERERTRHLLLHHLQWEAG